MLRKVTRMKLPGQIYSWCKSTVRSNWGDANLRWLNICPSASGREDQVCLVLMHLQTAAFEVSLRSQMRLFVLFIASAGMSGNTSGFLLSVDEIGLREFPKVRCFWHLSLPLNWARESFCVVPEITNEMMFPINNLGLSDKTRCLQTDTAMHNCSNF